MRHTPAIPNLPNCRIVVISGSYTFVIIDFMDDLPLCEDRIYKYEKTDYKIIPINSW